MPRKRIFNYHNAAEIGTSTGKSIAEVVALVAAAAVVLAVAAVVLAVAVVVVMRR